MSRDVYFWTTLMSIMNASLYSVTVSGLMPYKEFGLIMAWAVPVVLAHLIKQKGEQP